MMKSWADHTSSDEEDDPPMEETENLQLNDAAPAAGDKKAMNTTGYNSEDEWRAAEQVAEVERPSDARRRQRQPGEDFVEPPVEVIDLDAIDKKYQFPTDPPFTSFVGNVAFSLKNPDDLKLEVEQAVLRRTKREITIVNAKVPLDRRDQKHRGFGYVETETLEHLKLIMHLNDEQTQIRGRIVHFDTANQDQGGGRHRSRNNNDQRNSFPSGRRDGKQGGFGDMDGKQFQGGRFADQNRRASSGVVDNMPSGFSGSSNGERPTLKLKPRSAPRTDGGGSRPSGSSNIFGGAKARDASSWEKRRQGSQDTSTDKEAPKIRGDGKLVSENDAGRGSGRGGGGGRGIRGRADDQGRGRGRFDNQGRGRGRSDGQGRGRGRTDSQGRGRGRRESHVDRQPQQQQVETLPKRASMPAKLAVEPPAPESQPPVKSQNTFALLSVDDSDSD